MPENWPGHRSQAITAYKMQHVTVNVATPTPIGANAVNTTIAAALTAGNGVVVTPASMLNIIVGKWVSIVNGSTQEFTQVRAKTSTTFTVNLVNSYGTNSNLYSVDGCWIRGIIVGAPGSAETLTLFNGLAGVILLINWKCS